MAQNSVINFKVFLRDMETTDTRRFTIDAPVVTNFLFLTEKLRTIFPVLKEAHYKITWKDSDGDEITIATDEDIITALTEMKDAIKVLYITILKKNEEYCDDPVTLEADINVDSRMVVCDICDNRIDGFRYKCIQCPDYDLCRDCEHKGHHSEHMMVRMVVSDSFPRFTRRFVHDISRCMKRNIRAARKDSHKFSKHCHKAENPFCGSGKKFHGKGGEFSENTTDAEANNLPPGNKCPFGQTKNNNEGRCPFSSGEKPIVDDFLGALARQHLDPILNILTPPGQSQDGSERPLLLNVIQNAVDGFFGRNTSQNSASAAPNSTSAEQEKKSENSNQNPTPPKPTGNENSGQNNENKSPAANQGSSASAPMDLDNNNPAVPQQQPNFAPNSNQEKPAEPGWAFVAQNTQNHASSVSENNVAQPVAPTIIYHSNPVIAEGLTRLHEMGFSNESGLLTQLLEHHRGDVNEVVKALVDLRI